MPKKNDPLDQMIQEIRMSISRCRHNRLVDVRNMYIALLREADSWNLKTKELENEDWLGAQEAEWGGD